MISRNLLEVPPDVEVRALSVSELKVLLVRVVKGPRTWRSRPRAKREHVLQIDASPLNDFRDWNESVLQLLPGGQYLLYRNGYRLCCWNIAETRCIWVHDDRWDGPPVTEARVAVFNAEVVDEGLAAIIVMGIFDSEDAKRQ